MLSTVDPNVAANLRFKADASPAKVNLASLGTQVPHLHWHVIPRFTDDPHYPQPIWSTARRAREGVLREANTSALAGALAAALD